MGRRPDLQVRLRHETPEWLMHVALQSYMHVSEDSSMLCTFFDALEVFIQSALDSAALDYRFAQGASITTITSATISDDKSIVSWELTLEEVSFTCAAAFCM